MAAKSIVLKTAQSITTVVASISYSNVKVCVKCSGYCDKVKEVVKPYGYKWSWDRYQWEKILRVSDGAPVDREIEIARELLKQGIPVKVESDAIARRIESGDYKPVNPRWVKLAKTSDVVKLTWDESDSGMFRKEFENLKRCRCYETFAIISVDEYEVIYDIAESFGFDITPRAAALLKTAETTALGARVVTLANDPTLAQCNNAAVIQSDASAGQIDPRLKDVR